MTDLDAKHKDLRQRRLRRKRVYSHLFVLPPVVLIVGRAIFQDIEAVYALPVIALTTAVFCYLQARYLKMPSPFLWGVAGLFLNILAMVYLLGYAHGKGLPAKDP